MITSDILSEEQYNCFFNIIKCRYDQDIIFPEDPLRAIIVIDSIICSLDRIVDSIERMDSHLVDLQILLEIIQEKNWLMDCKHAICKSLMKKQERVRSLIKEYHSIN